MEEREEQLVDEVGKNKNDDGDEINGLQVEAEGVARRKAEARAVEAEGRAQVQEQTCLQETLFFSLQDLISLASCSSQVGRRLKSALLLTAAFGAAHTALQSELALECLPM